jgi:hypothetical protein
MIDPALNASIGALAGAMSVALLKFSDGGLVEDLRTDLELVTEAVSDAVSMVSDTDAVLYDGWAMTPSETPSA